MYTSLPEHPVTKEDNKKKNIYIYIYIYIYTVKVVASTDLKTLGAHKAQIFVQIRWETSF